MSERTGHDNHGGSGVDPSAGSDASLEDDGGAGRPTWITMDENDQKEWHLEYYDYTNPVTGRTYPLPIMTDGRCRIVVLGQNAFVSSFTYEEMWAGAKIEFSFEAVYIGQARTTYQVILDSALERHPEFWLGSPRDTDLLRHLMSNIRQGLCLLKSGPRDEHRITAVEIVLSRWSRWKDFSASGFEGRVR
jgi:hypothetical protein